MKDIFPELQPWLEQGAPFALATVVHTWGSAPRPVGSALAVSPEMAMLGSVSGGCVEGAVLKEALKTLDSGESTWLKFGVSNEEAWSVGLSCGGKVEVFVEPFVAFSRDRDEQNAWKALEQAFRQDQGCVWVTRLKEGEALHHFFQPGTASAGSLPGAGLEDLAAQAFRQRKTQRVDFEEEKYLIQVFPRRSRLLIVGAAHVTVDLVDLARQFDFETIVIDPRGIFAHKTQFRTPPDHLHVAWPAEVLAQYKPDPFTYAVLLTHDPKIDDQALHLLLRSEVAYIGALGSKRTHGRRVQRLQEAGFSEAEIARIHGPVGVDIHAKYPKEIALSILAELIQVKNRFL